MGLLLGHIMMGGTGGCARCPMVGHGGGTSGWWSGEAGVVRKRVQCGRREREEREGMGETQGMQRCAVGQNEKRGTQSSLLRQHATACSTQWLRCFAVAMSALNTWPTPFGAFLPWVT